MTRPGSMRTMMDFYDVPGPTIFDALWEPLAEAVMRPVFGDLTEALDQVRNLNSTDGASLVDKDLRSLLGQPVEGAFNLSYCGNGNLDACRDFAVAGGGCDRPGARR